VQEFYIEGGQQILSGTPVIEEHHTSDAGLSVSDAGISMTESGMCEMSRQASNTESTENPTETTFILDEIVRVSSEEGTSETMSVKSEDTLGQSNSTDSTEHGQSEGDNSDSVSGNVVEGEDKDDQQENSSDNNSEATVTEDINTDKITGHKGQSSKVEDDDQEDYEFDLPETTVL